MCKTANKCDIEFLFDQIVNREAITLQIAGKIFEHFHGAFSSPAFSVVEEYQTAQYIVIYPVVAPMRTSLLLRILNLDRSFIHRQVMGSHHFFHMSITH